ncbi:MAG: hypothetical protein LBM87_03205 [Ruminococcus sp.]|jgi:hypothetical protein|nr:hypothetical protein [Ruminococcus sp.]
MNKKLSKALLIFTLLLTVGIIILTNYSGGRMKTADKFFDALSSDDIALFEKTTSLNFDSLKKAMLSASGFTTADEPKFEVSYRGKTTLSDEIYTVYVKITAFDDERSRVFDNAFMSLEKNGSFSWRVTGIKGI